MNVRELIELHESRVAHVYPDSLGFATIGVGHLIDARKGGKLPDHIITALRDYDIEEKSGQLYDALPWIAQIGTVRQAVLTDMAFNLGVEGLLNFKETLKHFQDANWRAAAAAMLDSTWATQVGARARRLADMTISGEWPQK